MRKHTKKKLNGAEKKHICQYHLGHQNAPQEDIAKMFDIERSTVSKILKLKSHWLNECATLDKQRYTFRPLRLSTIAHAVRATW